MDVNLNASRTKGRNVLALGLVGVEVRGSVVCERVVVGLLEADRDGTRRAEAAGCARRLVERVVDADTPHAQALRRAAAAHQH